MHPDVEISDAKSILETMAALGASIDAPQGSWVWVVRVPERENKGDRSTKPLGVYNSEAEAYAALADHAKSVWEKSYYYSPNAPWYHYPNRDNQHIDMRAERQSWIAGKPDAEIAEMYIYLLSENNDCTFPNDIGFYIVHLQVGNP